MMLVEYDFRAGDPRMTAVLGVISNGPGGVMPRQVPGVSGYYKVGHWSIDQLVGPGVLEPPWLEVEIADAQGVVIGAFGVVDSIEQFDRRIGDQLRAHKRRMFVTFVEIRREDQSPDGGWRWHKWGPYLGDQKPQHEYLYDETHIERVFTFSIHTLAEPTVAYPDVPCIVCGAERGKCVHTGKRANA